MKKIKRYLEIQRTAKYPKIPLDILVVFGIIEIVFLVLLIGWK